MSSIFFTHSSSLLKIFTTQVNSLTDISFKHHSFDQAVLERTVSHCNQIKHWAPKKTTIFSGSRKEHSVTDSSATASNSISSPPSSSGPLTDVRSLHFREQLYKPGGDLFLLSSPLSTSILLLACVSYCSNSRWILDPFQKSHSPYSLLSFFSCRKISTALFSAVLFTFLI